MATVRPHLAPRPPPPAPPPPLPPVAPPLPPTYVRASRRADAHVRRESVAESCCPSSEAANMVIDVDSGSGSDDDDGCGSCVDGGEGQDEEGGEVVFRWSQDCSSSSRPLWPPAYASRSAAAGGLAGDERDGDDPKAAAARRQEDDRKFWEACLASGYP